MSLTRAAIAVVAAAALGAGGLGCSNLGFGKVVPGSAPRFRAGRQFGVQQLGGGWYRMGAIGAPAEAVGGGRIGGVVGGRLGLGTMRVGDRAQHGGGFDVRAEVMVELWPWLGVGGSAGWGMEVAGQDADKVVRTGFPLAAIATMTPLKPFVLRGGAVYEPGDTRIGDVETADARVGFEAAGGIAVAFRGWHFVVLVDWRHLGGAEAMAGGAPVEVASDLYLLDAWVAM
ncbi:MAG: hypothetical protein IPH44_07400 [Myxococcales bacterium]|jgi:hypothetical protein|nr:hypothetical protein [Myxococcales bacterium]